MVQTKDAILQRREGAPSSPHYVHTPSLSANIPLVGTLQDLFTADDPQSVFFRGVLPATNYPFS